MMKIRVYNPSIYSSVIVSIGNDCFEISGNQPNEINMYIGTKHEITLPVENRVKISTLSAGIKKAIKQRYLDIKNDIKRDIEKQHKILSGLIEYADKKNMYIEYYTGCCEPGYDDKIVVAANWNDEKLKRIGDYIENHLEEIASVEWSDEWSRCDNCYKALRMSPDSYSWTRYGIIVNDCELICLDCVMEDIEAYIDEFKNVNDRAIPPELIEPIKEIGFNCDALKCERFETGFHPGQNDTPEKVLQDIYDNVGEKWFHQNYDYVFAITSVSQFEIDWTILTREKGEED